MAENQWVTGVLTGMGPPCSIFFVENLVNLHEAIDRFATGSISSEEFCSGWFATCTVYAILLMEEILSCTSWYEEYAIFHRFSKITGGVGFLPATVWTKVPKLSQVKSGLMIALISHPTLKMGIKRSHMWFSEAEKGMLTRKLIQSYYWWKKSG